MNGTPATSAGPLGVITGTPLTRPERQALHRALLVGRGLERVLASLRGRVGAATSGELEAVLAAIAAAAGLEPGDRLIVPHTLLAAHLAAGASPAEIAAARLGEPPGPRADQRLRAGVGPQSPVGIAVGSAFALRHGGADAAAVALVDRRWAEVQECRSALALARELALPLVVVAIDGGAVSEGVASVVDRRDFEAVLAAVAAAIAGAHGDRGPSLVVCAAVPASESRENQLAALPQQNRRSAVAYERSLMINGFSRADLDAVRATRPVSSTKRSAIGSR